MLLRRIISKKKKILAIDSEQQNFSIRYNKGFFCRSYKALKRNQLQDKCQDRPSLSLSPFLFPSFIFIYNFANISISSANISFYQDFNARHHLKLENCGDSKYFYRQW